MTKKKLLALVSKHWYEFERAAGFSSYLEKAITVSERIEREHRAMGRRVMSGIATPRYTLSVTWTARYFVMKNTVQKIEVPATWLDIASYRRDFPLCQALREEMAEKRCIPNLSEEFYTIDYAGDIALKC